MLDNILNKRLFKLILFIILSLVVTLPNANNCFFWDTISQISIPANWYYDNNFRYFFVPDEFATGHPTFVGMYIALLWKLFGKSLLVSHLAMLPFIFGIFFQLDSFLQKADSRKIIPFLILLIVICDATLVSQMSMITFDIPQIFFFLWCINNLMKGNYIVLSIAFVALVLTSLRGSICGVGVILYAILISFQNSKRIPFKTLLSFLPGLSALALFLTVFFIEKHWIIHNSVSGNWKQSAEFASLPDIFRNIGLVAWQLIDYGRIGIWIMFLVILLISIKRKVLFDKFYANSFYIALCQFVAIFPIVIIYRNPFGHRYFLPLIIFVTISVTYWILRYSKNKIIIYSLIFILVISGHFWIYPKKLSQGWDATPAHWPYYSLRNEILDYLKTNKIPVDKIGSFFPNLASFKLMDLVEDKSSFKVADLEEDNYILFSSVSNLKDEVIDELFYGKNWIREKSVKKRGVYIILFKRVK